MPDPIIVEISLGVPIVVEISPATASSGGGYVKPGAGIPSSDMTAAVQASLSKADSAVQPAALTSKADLVAGLIPTSQIPGVALTTGQAVTSRAAMLALTNVQEGDIVSITTTADKGTYLLGAGPRTVFASWLMLSTPTDVVTSVNGQNGVVVLGKGDVGLGNVDNTSDANKPVSTLQATAIAASTLVPVSAQTAAYTLALVDANAAVEVTSAGAVNVTVPPAASVAFPIGCVIEVAQIGAGQLTLVAGAGVTLLSAGGALKTRAQYSAVSLRKRATDTWLVVGDLA